MNIGEFISEYRKKNDLSMDDFSKISGLSKAYISVLEKNKRPKTDKPVIPSITTIKQVAEATNIDFNDLIVMLDSDQQVDISQTSYTPPQTIAAHATEDLTDEEQEKVREYIQFLKMKRGL